MSDRPVIEIPAADDPTLGWLSNSSKHPFVVDSLQYPTVEHFLLAKKFEGTTLEEQIRTSRSLHSARLLTNPKSVIDVDSGVAVKNTVYGKERNFSVREDWNQVYYGYLETALTLKFKQHPALKKKLMALAGMEIVDPKSSLTGEMLEELRDRFIDDLKPKYRAPSFPHPYKDLATATLSKQEEKVIKSLIKIAGWVGELEGVSVLQQGVFEDAIYNILVSSGYDEPTANGVVDMILKWVSTAFSEWTITVKSMPHFTALVENTTSYVAVSKTDEDATFRIRVIIASFVRWLRIDTSKERNTVYTKTPTIRMTDITIPAKIRTYRAIPSKIYIKRKPVVTEPIVTEPSPIAEGDPDDHAVADTDDDADIQRGVLYIKTFVPLSLAPETYSKVVAMLEAMGVSDRNGWLDAFSKMTVEEQRSIVEGV